MRQELRHGPLWRLVPDSGLNVRLCLMRARCASATNPVAPGTASDAQIDAGRGDCSPDSHMRKVRVRDPAAPQTRISLLT